MRLSDRDILTALDQGTISLSPTPRPEAISGCTIDLHLNNRFRVFNPESVGFIDLASSAKSAIEDMMSPELEITPDGIFRLHPGELALGSTLERVTLPDNLVGWLDGRSSLARLGLMVHITAHRIDPGWDGEIVLEFFNAGRFPLIMRPNMPIAAISFETLSSPALFPYYKRHTAKYRNQSGPVASRLESNHDEPNQFP
jgi:dCTP deaminase